MDSYGVTVKTAELSTPTSYAYMNSEEVVYESI